MKNNSLAMVATVSLAMGLASLVGYVDPGVCTVNVSESLQSCEQVANQHILGFVGFSLFGVLTLLVGWLRGRRRVRRLSASE